ncbi:hypothetical protein EDC01DRAFT_730593 [Geopyxis carbonaria]|nr:hypothetical protein EDC01DRAFT_730593 [Geopyxis carbonaria]
MASYPVFNYNSLGTRSDNKPGWTRDYQRLFKFQMVSGISECLILQLGDITAKKSTQIRGDELDLRQNFRSCLIWMSSFNESSTGDSPILNRLLHLSVQSVSAQDTRSLSSGSTPPVSSNVTFLTEGSCQRYVLTPDRNSSQSSKRSSPDPISLYSSRRDTSSTSCFDPQIWCLINHAHETRANSLPRVCIHAAIPQRLIGPLYVNTSAPQNSRAAFTPQSEICVAGVQNIHSTLFHVQTVAAEY